MIEDRSKLTSLPIVYTRIQHSGIQGAFMSCLADFEPENVQLWTKKGDYVRIINQLMVHTNDGIKLYDVCLKINSKESSDFETFLVLRNEFKLYGEILSMLKVRTNLYVKKKLIMGLFANKKVYHSFKMYKLILLLDHHASIQHIEQCI